MDSCIARPALAFFAGIALIVLVVTACGPDDYGPRWTSMSGATPGANAGSAANGQAGSLANVQAGSGANSLAGAGGAIGASGATGASGTTGAAGMPAAGASGAGTGGSMMNAGASGSSPMTNAGSTATNVDSGTPDPGSTAIGSGDINDPVAGPPPVRAADVGGAPFVLVKNWDFGSDGTVPDVGTLIAEFQFHDQFGTIANGTNYGAVTVAPTADTAIAANNLGLPGNMQPVEDPARPYREFTPEAIKTYVRTLSEQQSNASVSAHDAGNGSFMAKWKLPNGGALLDKDLLWEVRARMPKPAQAFWFAIWTAGNQWNKGAEMDVLESFGTPNIYPPAAAYHVNSVGGHDDVNYSSWPSALDSVHVPMADRDLTQWHVWTWVYGKDDSFTVYMDGYVVQTGSIHWTLGGGQGGEALDLQFLFDLGWGHTQIADENISLPASDFPIEYEIDYSRVYLR